ncbi:FHA domain-containing protein [Alloiococcus sp. CFN-8]|uniref:FHA domain-containing protein n=1 Tax=Alloiococcus sp. CFN-8 TaxID=3416081 RepID=UPI003CF59A03
MNSLIEGGTLIEKPCGTNFAYVLADNSSFMSTEYKVLQNQGNGFVKCMKMSYNGKTQLYYLTNGQKSLAGMLPNLDADGFLTIVGNLFSNIIDAKNNGFLSCENIDLAFEKIFVDPATFKVKLIYLPTRLRLFADYFAFENQLRTSLIKLINSIEGLSSPKTMELAVNLGSGTLSLEDIYSRVKSGVAMERGADRSRGQGSYSVNKSTMSIISMNAPIHVELEITKDKYVIGKNVSGVDGAITFNKAISRVHCQIDRHDGSYTITDLGSSNGTFVNKVRLAANRPHPLKNGDVIRLANSDFQVSIG